MMCFNEPYEYEGKEPMEIKNDFIDYCMDCDVHGMETILRAIAVAVPSEQLGSIMDDRGKIQDIYARNVEQAADKWQNMRLNSQETFSIVDYSQFK
jgi:hypothetical protein